MRADSDDRVKVLYGAPGASISQVARTLGCSRRTVSRRLDRLAIPRKQPAQQMAQSFTPTPARVQQIIFAYDRERTSLRALGARYERSPSTIRRLLESEGVPIRGRGRPRKRRGRAAPPRRVLALHADGLPPGHIASRLGRTKAEVLGVLHASQLRPNRGRPMPPAAELAEAFARAGSVRALSGLYHISEDRLRVALDAAHARPAGGRAGSAVSRPRAAAPATCPDAVPTTTRAAREVVPAPLREGQRLELAQGPPLAAAEPSPLSVPAG